MNTRCLLLLVDGLRPDLAETRLASGELPHLQSMLATGGQTRAITVFPSTTSVAYLPFLTGCTPGRCNIPSIRWLDRRAYGGRWWRDRDAVRSYCGYQAPLLDHDIAADVRTIFELVPESLGIFTPVARGLTPSAIPRGSSGSSGARSRTTRSGTSRRTTPSPATCCARWTDRRGSCSPSFQRWTGTPTRPTPTRRRCGARFDRVDAVVGRVRERLRQRGELESTLILRRERPRRRDGAYPPRPGRLVPRARGADAVPSGALGGGRRGPR